MQAKNEKVSREVFDKMDNAPLISSVLLNKKISVLGLNYLLMLVREISEALQKIQNFAIPLA